MPLWLQYIDFAIGILSFFITIFTLKTAYRVKKQLIHNAELGDFRENIENILQQIQGYIASINDDGLSDEIFNSTLIQFLTDLQTRYTFLSRNTKHLMGTLNKLLNKPSLSPNDWHDIANYLIKLKNYLKKERVIYG